MSSYIPDPAGAPQELGELRAFIERELERISSAFGGVLPSTLQETFVEPQKKRDGQLVFADGQRWNPGQGRGVYVWASGWHLVSPTLPGRGTPVPELPPPSTEPPATPTLPTLSSITPATSALQPGGIQPFTLRLSAIAPEVANITLTVSDNSIASAPTSVNVPQGAQTVSFNLTALADGNVNVTASYNGTTRQATVSVQSDTVSVPLPTEGIAVPTYHCCGLYWTPPSAPEGDSDETILEFRRVGTVPWLRGLNMWYDSRGGESRGSLVHLDPDTEYEARFSLTLGSPLASVRFRTRSDTPQTTPATLPISGGSEASPLTTLVGAGTFNGTTQRAVLYLPESGSGTVNADGSINYRLYDFTSTPTWVRAPNSEHHYGVVIRASRVILRGLNVRGGVDGIVLLGKASDVIIENCDIADWGVSRGIFCAAINNYLGMDERAAIRVPYANNPDRTDVRRITIQRCKLHDPKFGASPWDVNAATGAVLTTGDDHSVGPNAIFLGYTGGGHVIRYNEVYAGDKGRWFNDGIGGADNFSDRGFPAYDSDIYGNSIKNVYDDGIEAEGGNRNVRIWQNYLDEVFVGIASTVTHFGPLYCWRNVVDRSRKYHFRDLDRDDRGQFFKSGRTNSYGDGRRYIFHNTAIQRDNDSGSRGLGVGTGISGNTGQVMSNTRIMNNIWHVWRYTAASIYYHESTRNNKTTDDCGNGNLSGLPQGDGVGWEKFNWPGSGGNTTDTTSPMLTYKAGHGPGFVGKWQLNPGSPGHDTGTTIFNFNDAQSQWPALGAGPDKGAHEEGSAIDMTFGLLSNAR